VPRCVGVLGILSSALLAHLSTAAAVGAGSLERVRVPLILPGTMAAGTDPGAGISHSGTRSTGHFSPPLGGSMVVSHVDPSYHSPR